MHRLFMLFLDFQKFHVEYECRVWLYCSTSTAFAVTKLIGDVKFVLGTNTHKLQAFSPASDNTVEWKFGWFATVV